MIWRLIFLIILIACVVHLCKGAYHYVPLTKFHHFVVPVYSLIMFLICFRWDWRNFWEMIVMVIAAMLIGWYQTSGIETKTEPGKHGRLRYLVKRNKPYVIGWVVMLAAGIILGEISQPTNLLSMFSDKIFEEIFQELDPLLIFSEKHPWYIWLLSGVSSLTFAWLSSKKIDREIAAEKPAALKEEKIIEEEEKLKERKQNLKTQKKSADAVQYKADDSPAFSQGEQNGQRN